MVSAERCRRESVARLEAARARGARAGSVRLGGHGTTSV